MELKYTRTGDYELPNLTLNDNRKGTINKYGMLRLDYLKTHKKTLYTTLLMKDELTNHLISVSKDAEDLLNTLMQSYKNSDEKLSEKSKEINQLEWVKLMNNYKNTAEEIILKELIYTKNV
ncbi:MAG: TnpV protein [Clostridia bacterium]|nr:TnpV protein [Clostridia bacterium]